MQYLDLSDASTRAGVRSEYGPDFLGESAIFDRELARNPNRQHELWPEGRVLSKADDPYLSVQEFWVPKTQKFWKIAIQRPKTDSFFMCYWLKRASPTDSIVSSPCSGYGSTLAKEMSLWAPSLHLDKISKMPPRFPFLVVWPDPDKLPWSKLTNHDII